MGLPDQKDVTPTSPQVGVAKPWGRREWVFFAVSALLLVIGLWQQRQFFHDDAYVPLRYVARLLAGQGLTWNAGERVEGFSSPAWLFQTAVLGALKVPLPLATRMLGLAYTLATISLWLRRRADPVGLLALVALPGFTMWAWGGLETISFVFWVLLATALVLRLVSDPGAFRSGFLLGLSLAMVALTRPEGFGVSVVLAGAAWPGRRNRSAVLAFFGFLLVCTGYEVFRLVYFGDFIANGARAKTLGLDLGRRLWFGGMYAKVTAPLWLGSALLAGFVLLWAKPRLWRLLLPILPLLLAVALAAGDHMLGARLMLAPVAVLCWAAALVPTSPPAWARRSVPVLAGLCVLWQFNFVLQKPAEPNPAAAMGEVVGSALEAKLPAGTLVATATAGSVPFFAPSLRFIDTLGLNDRHIARQAPGPWPEVTGDTEGWFALPGHWRGDADYVLSRQPDAVIFGGANGDVMPWFLGDYQLVGRAAFRADYAPLRLKVEVPPASRAYLGDAIDSETDRLPITLYVRRDSPAWQALLRDGAPVTPPWLPSSGAKTAP